MEILKPYNSYNLFFIMERTLLLEARQIGASNMSSHPPATAAPLTGYEFIELPPLPPRYQHLQSTLATDWYDPGRNKRMKRRHSKSHGVASFREMAKTMADNWKAIDPPTKIYVDAVAKLLKKRYKEMSLMGGLGCFNVGQLPASIRMVYPITSTRPITQILKGMAESILAPAQDPSRNPQGKTSMWSTQQQHWISTTKLETADLSSMSSLTPFNLTTLPPSISVDYCTTTSFQTLQNERDPVLDPAPRHPVLDPASTFMPNDSSGTTCREVDVSDMEILDIYHSI